MLDNGYTHCCIIIFIITVRSTFGKQAARGDAASIYARKINIPVIIQGFKIKVTGTDQNLWGGKIMRIDGKSNNGSLFRRGIDD